MSTLSTPRRTVPFNDHVGIEVVPAPPGAARTQIPDRHELKNHFETVHGGALFTAGEVAAGTAMLQLLGADILRLRAITRKASIEYRKPARGVITAEAVAALSREEILAELAKSEKLTVRISVTLTDASAVEVARMEVEWFVGNPKS
jgi:acyl-coenzyme A thioesterase PaaI-like protein